MNAADLDELRLLVQIDAAKRLATKQIIECSSKHKFASYDQAKHSLSPRLRHLVAVYHCPRCKGYHVGGIANRRLRRLYGERRKK